ncbi:hypothetical protein FACS189413_18630 [Bacteroidia bacterium]|nr:hypothetical protein FACS189413_18630 [Bacteroidia bacterium]
MKHLKWITIIIVITIVLIKLFVPPKWGGRLPENIRESKRIGAFLWEYEISCIDTLEPNYNFPKFKNIWMTKRGLVKRNKFGIIHLVANYSSKNYIVFDIQNKDTVFNMDNYFRKWEIIDDFENSLGIDVGVLSGHNVKCNRGDTIHYIIYKVMKPFSKVPEDFIPLFGMTLVAKPDKD